MLLVGAVAFFCFVLCFIQCGKHADYTLLGSLNSIRSNVTIKSMFSIFPFAYRRKPESINYMCVYRKEKLVNRLESVRFVGYI